jgi:hypothetical protein
MQKDNTKINEIEHAIEKKYKAKEKRKKVKMKVSGAGVKRLAKIIQRSK